MIDVKASIKFLVFSFKQQKRDRNWLDSDITICYCQYALPSCLVRSPSMQTMTPPRPGRVIFREGLIFGVLLGIVHTVLFLLNQSLAQSGLSTLGLLVIVLIWLGVFFWSGVRGAKQTARVGTGALTGLMTAVFAGFIALIAWIVSTSIQMASSSSSTIQFLNDYYHKQGLNVTITPASIIGIIALCGTILWLLGIGTGAGLGALGGLLGRSQSTVLPPVPNYPGYPPYGYGQAPMQTPYPPTYTPPYPNQPSQPPQPPDQPYQ